MPSTFVPGEPAPLDGSLPAESALGAGERSLSMYVHVPFCAVRCGYCDFNTYTNAELGGGADLDRYAQTASGEIRLARRALDAAGAPPRALSTVFFGGGTPTRLPADDLAALLATARAEFGLAPDAEVTTEANPDSVTPESLAALRAAGFTRVSFGMQSAVPRVLAVLERTHDPANVARAVAWATAAGLDTSVDLIYGAPGETMAEWRASLAAAIELGTDHVSAYSLIVEPGTKLARDIARGRVAQPSDDDHADKYLLAEELLGAAGFGWYEVSNFARGDAAASRHNVAYWRSQDWWGVGPGAHSHVGGTRWWNVKHPRAYAERLDAGLSPVHERERLDADTRRVERIMLETRLRSGLDLGLVSPAARRLVGGYIARGLVDGRAALAGRLALTLEGRLLADAIVRDLVD